MPIRYGVGHYVGWADYRFQPSTISFPSLLRVSKNVALARPPIIRRLPLQAMWHVALKALKKGQKAVLYTMEGVSHIEVVRFKPSPLGGAASSTRY